VTLVQPICALDAAAVARHRGGALMRLTGQRSNTTLLLITLVVVIALLAAGYVLFIVPR
jgi:hypothetical protein